MSDSTSSPLPSNSADVSATTPAPSEVPTPPTNSTPATAPTPSTTAPKKKSSPWVAIVVVLGIFLVIFIALAFALGLWVFEKNEDSSSSGDSDSEEFAEQNDTPFGDYEEEDEDEDDKDSDEEESDDEEEVAELTTFAGTYVTAELPDGWTIVEYTDGDGSDMLVEQPYTGITAIKIFTPDAIEAFSLIAVDGIGGIGACSTYYQFADDNPAYLIEKQAEADEMSMTMTIMDLSGTEYSEFDLFDYTVRRIGTELYKDHTAGNGFFEAECGISDAFTEIEQLTFMADTYESHTFQDATSDSISEVELEILDSILASLHEI